MKNVILLLTSILLANIASAHTKSINPEKVEYNLFDLSTGRLKNGQYSVKGVEFNQINQTYEDNGAHFKVDKKTYEQAKARAVSVLRATPGDSSTHFGTAFHVGGNLIFTNQHVLSVSRKNTTQCKSFRVRLNSNQRGKSLKCKKVHYCHKGTDFCLIEMHPHRKGYALSKQTPAQLKRNPVISKDNRTMSVGNSRGFGIHAATGFGLEKYGNVFKFYAPVWGGNSGGAVFNDHGEVIGLVRAQSTELYSKDSYNVAIPMEFIHMLLTHALKESPEVMSQINFIN